MIVDPIDRTVAWLGRREGAYEPVEPSGRIDLRAAPAELAERLAWL